MSPSITASLLSSLPWLITQCVAVLVRQSATSFQYEVVPILTMNTAAVKTKYVWSQLNQILSNPPKLPIYSIHKSKFIVNVNPV